MDKVKVEICLFSYDELEEKAKQKAFYEHKDFMDSLEEEYENEKGELIKEFIDHDEESVKDSIEANDYLFFENGEPAHTVTYTGKHPKSGKKEFFYFGETYELN